jgi:hypothetical protein
MGELRDNKSTSLVVYERLQLLKVYLPLPFRHEIVVSVFDVPRVGHHAVRKAGAREQDVAPGRAERADHDIERFRRAVRHRHVLRLVFDVDPRDAALGSLPGVELRDGSLCGRKAFMRAVAIEFAAAQRRDDGFYNIGMGLEERIFSGIAKGKADERLLSLLDGMVYGQASMVSRYLSAHPRRCIDVDESVKDRIADINRRGNIPSRALAHRGRRRARGHTEGGDTR